MRNVLVAVLMFGAVAAHAQPVPPQQLPGPAPVSPGQQLVQDVLHHELYGRFDILSLPRPQLMLGQSLLAAQQEIGLQETVWHLGVTNTPSPILNVGLFAGGGINESKKPTGTLMIGPTVQVPAGVLNDFITSKSQTWAQNLRGGVAPLWDLAHPSSLKAKPSDVSVLIAYQF